LSYFFSDSNGTLFMCIVPYFWCGHWNICFFQAKTSFRREPRVDGLPHKSCLSIS